MPSFPYQNKNTAREIKQDLEKSGFKQVQNTMLNVFLSHYELGHTVSLQ